MLTVLMPQSPHKQWFLVRAVACQLPTTNYLRLHVRNMVGACSRLHRNSENLCRTSALASLPDTSGHIDKVPVLGACHFCRSGQMHKCEIRNVDTAKALSIMVFESMSIYT
jgi:hypothetical protein